MIPFIVLNSRVSKPNTPSSDNEAEILCSVLVEQGALQYEFKIYATDPMDAIRRTQELSPEELGQRLDEQYRNRQPIFKAKT